MSITQVNRQLRSGKAMNFYGKLLMGFLMVCLMAAVYFTTGVLKARSTWLAKIEATALKIETAEKDAMTAKRQFEDARNLVHWENDTWGKAWVAPNSGPAPAADGSIELGAGSNVGIGRGQADPAKLPIVHVFGTDAQGQSVYIGDFQLTEVRADSAGAKLTRPVYPNEVDSWPRGEYRIRELVPHDNLSAIATLRTLVILADQNIVHETAMLAYQDQNLAASQAALDERMGELNGKPDAPEQAGPDVKDGLVQTMRREETARNAVVKQVDALRRELSDVYLHLTTTLAENQANTQKLSASKGSPSKPARVAAEKATNVGQ